MREQQSNAISVGMLAAGMAAGILGSRFLPPLIASAIGSRRVRSGQDPFELLVQDHRQIQSVLNDMVMTPEDSSMKRSRLFLTLKRKLAKHALAEEDVVYPLLHGELQHANESKHLYEEHADMKILLFRLEELLKSGKDWSEAARSLRNLVQQHVNEEENNVFPELRTRVGRKRMPKVSGQIRREEALIV